jgi:hypothetical protein
MLYFLPSLAISYSFALPSPFLRPSRRLSSYSIDSSSFSSKGASSKPGLIDFDFEAPLLEFSVSEVLVGGALTNFLISCSVF